MSAPPAPQRAIDCLLIRGGTSKGAYFRAADLPADRAAMARILLAAMGSPDPRQIDGVGGADPLTSKVAVVGPSTRDDSDVDYLFAQVVVDEPRVDYHQNCGNILAGVGPFAIERGMVAVRGDVTPVRIHMVNSGTRAVAHVRTPDGRVAYAGDARIDGVPGTAAPVLIEFLDVAGGTCGALLPTGAVRDEIDGVPVTMIDNGMPVVVLPALALGCSGGESPAALDADARLKDRIEAIRRQAGRRMNLGDVAAKNVPKMTLVSAPRAGGTLATRTFIPHVCHTSIGVLGAVSVATACVLPGSVAHDVAAHGAVPAPPTPASPMPAGARQVTVSIEHPTGEFTVVLDAHREAGAALPTVTRTALLRTARLLFDGRVMVRAAVGVSA